MWVGINDGSRGEKGNRGIVVVHHLSWSGVIVVVCLLLVTLPKARWPPFLVAKKRGGEESHCSPGHYLLFICWLAHGCCFSYEKGRGGKGVMRAHLNVVHASLLFVHCWLLHGCCFLCEKRKQRGGSCCSPGCCPLLVAMLLMVSWPLLLRRQGGVMLLTCCPLFVHCWLSVMCPLLSV